MSEAIEPILTSEEEEYDAQAVPTEDIFIDSLEAQTKSEEKTPEPETKPEPAPQEARPEWLDQRFKSVEDQAKSYREAEKEMQRSRSESSELRKLVDQYILGGLQQKPDAKASQMTPEEMAEQEIILQRIAPVLKPLYDEVARLRTQAATDTTKEAVKSANADHFDVVNSPEFAEFAMKSFPVALLRTADSDPEIAAFVVSKFKESKKAQTPSPVVTPVAEKPQFTESARTAPAGDKVFSRAQLIRMQHENPERYMELQPEILRAYAEKRVR